MSNVVSKKKRNIWRTTARILSVIACTFWMLTMIISTIEAYQKTAKLQFDEGMIVLTFALLSTIASFIAWKMELIGGVLLILTGTSLGTFAYLTSERKVLFSIVMSGGPFFVSGILFLISSQIKNISRKRTNESKGR